MTTKVRLVRCPKCRLVLPELADVPVYKCGGCGAVLQAKIRKPDANDGPTSNIVQTSPAPKPILEHASDDIAATILNQESTIISSEHAAKDQSDDSAVIVKEPSGYINHSGDPRSSTDISSHENPESSPEAATALIDSDTDTCNPDQDDSDKEQHGDMNASELGYYNRENEPLSVQREVDESICSLDEENGVDRYELEDSSRELPTELTSHEVKDPSQETVLDTKVEENMMKKSAFRSVIAEKLLDSRPRKLASTSQSLVGDDDVERSHSSKFQGFDYTESAKNLESARFNKPRSDLGVQTGGVSKSPTGRSYNAYEGSVSSFERNDDQFVDSHLIPRRRNYGVSSKEMPKGDNLRGNLGRNQNAMNHGSKWDHEFQGHMRNDHPIRNMNTLKGNDARSSRVPFNERGSRANQYNSTYVKPDDQESEKMALLRMVHQLQDQLDRTNLLTANPNGGYPPRVDLKESQMSSYYHLPAEREMHHDVNYSRYPGRYGQGKSWSHQYQPSRTAYSGETLPNRGQIDCSCFHCHSQERHYSAHLPPRDIYCRKVHYGTHYSPYQSGTSSPQRPTGSEYSLWDHETRSNDQWQRKDRDMKKHQPPKRHFRPVAGGSPLVACYLCTETLQLPAESFLFRRRYHILKCNACSKILKFSVQNKTRLVPYVPESENIAPPPSEVDEYPDPSKARILEPVPRASYAQHAASGSYSDDYGGAYRYSDNYGGAFSKDYSTETDASYNAAPFDRRMPSVSSSNSTVDRKKSVLQTYGTSRFSSKKTWSEIEEVEETRGTSGSPLHRLMGYASPSKVIRGE